jgi:hypothetical protein
MFTLVHTQEKLIDLAFRFKTIMGYYPKQKGNTWREADYRVAQQLGLPTPRTFRDRFGTLAQAWHTAEAQGALDHGTVTNGC